MFDVTVIIPTFKEEANIGRIIAEVDAVFKQHAINGEILVVDDNSPDGTIAIVNEQKKTRPNLNIVVRQSDHGLSQSVVDGFVHASSDIFVVMDADLSHPPALIPTMVNELRAGHDVVIGSRYMEGGGIKKWPLKRRVISIGATFLGRLLIPDVTDPVSGFFAVRKSVVENAPLKPRGYKILLEILGKGKWEKEQELPFEFVDREIGSSKLALKTILEYTQQVIDIAIFSWKHHETAVWQEWKKIIKFGLVGLSGIVVNMAVLIILKEYAGFPIPVASLFAIELSIMSNFLLNDLWTFQDSNNHKLTHWWQRLLSFQLVSIGGALINFSLLNVMAYVMGVDYRVANIVGILVGFGWNFMVNRRVTWKLRTGENPHP